ncbi:hypothetical protein GO308_03065 [Sphingomonas sp. SFZ2018-12]|nr:hypothetical protein [Sphingomonas sp. SFZ2018-12]
MKRDQPLALPAAALAAIVVPMLVLALAGRGGAAPARHRAPAPPIRIVPMAAEATPRLFSRPLFAPDRSVIGDGVPADAPALVGVVGRIDRDAVALVREAGGTGAARALAVGESIDGWRLVSLTIDAAYFERAGRRARVPLPGDPAVDQ